MCSYQYRPGVLKLGGGLWLNVENAGVGAADADSGVTLADGFESVLDLEEMAVGTTNSLETQRERERWGCGGLPLAVVANQMEQA